MTANAAFSPLASAVPPDEHACPLPNDASLATRETSFAVPVAPAVPVKIAATSPNAANDANSANPPNNANVPNGVDSPHNATRPSNANAPNGVDPPSNATRPNNANAPSGVDPPSNADNAPPENNANAENALNDANDVDFADGAGKIDWNAALSSNERWLRSTIATQVGENAAVDEVFQDVALAAARQKAPIRDPRKIGAWLRRLATVYSLLYRRSLGRKKKLLQRYQDRVPPREAAGVDAEPLHWLLTEERRALVRQATALLADDERRVLTLKYAEDRSYKEIAEEIGATVSAVQSKLHRARARLREKLAELAPTTIAPPT